MFNLLDSLRRYRPLDQADRECRRRFIRFVETYKECCQRSLTIGHVTGSAWVVDERGEHVLLTHHAKLNRWLQLGGHADGNPDILSVAVREAEEESGLRAVEPLSREIFDLDIHLIPATDAEAAHLHHDVRFVLRAVGAENLKISRESLDLRWIKIEDLHQLTDEPSLMRMARKWAQMKEALMRQV